MCDKARWWEFHVFTNEVDWIAAYDLDDVARILHEQYGLDGDYMLDEFVALPDDESLTIFFDNGDLGVTAVPASAERDRDESRGVTLFTASCRDWYSTLGRGFLCSTEV